METGLTLLPSNHAAALEIMHPHAANLMKAKYEGQKITGLIPEEMIPAIRTAIQDCFKSLGHWDSSKDTDVLEHQTKEMVVYFLRDYKNITIQEFKIILRNMVKGDYRVKDTDIITCTVQSMCHGIKSYLASQEYKMAFTDYQTKLKLDAPQKKEPSQEEQEYIVQKGLEEAIKKFKDEGEYPPVNLCYVFYSHLKKRNELVLTTEQKEEYLNTAKEICEAKLKQERGTMNQKAFKEAMAKIQVRGHAVTNKAKELAFKDYLTKLK